MNSAGKDFCCANTATGARGYGPGALLQTALRALLADLPGIDTLASEEPVREDLADTLTGREVEILQLLCQGLSNKEIAPHLFLGVRTVEVPVANLYRKLGVHSRATAIIAAARHG